ncbi:hypothetical protein GCM10010519_36360 [Streptomyces lactacystinicus]
MGRDESGVDRDEPGGFDRSGRIAVDRRSTVLGSSNLNNYRADGTGLDRGGAHHPTGPDCSHQAFQHVDGAGPAVWTLRDLPRFLGTSLRPAGTPRTPIDDHGRVLTRCR